MLKFRGVLLFFSLLLVSALFIFSTPSFAENENWGCCIDTVLGCRNVFGSDEITDCSANFAFEEGISCFPIAGNEDVLVTSRQECQLNSCCCTGDSFIEDLNQDQCSSLGGNFETGSNCYEVCKIDVPSQDTTCLDLGGNWCLEENAQDEAILLSPILDYDKPGDGYFCYNLPCKAEDDDVLCEMGDLPLEVFCTNGINDDSDCLVDTADSDCSYYVQGTVVDIYNRPVSNVKIKFINKDHMDNPSIFGGYVDSFVTYSVGKNGEFYFQGLSEGNYYAEVIDDYYESSIGVLTFEVSSSNPFSSGLRFEVVPRNAFILSGYVLDNNLPILGAVVSLENTNLYATTNSEGFYEIPNVPKLSKTFSYNAIVFKENYFPEKSKITYSSNTEKKTVSFDLDSALCSVRPSAPILNSLSNVFGSTAINLSFNSGNCQADVYYIYRCEGDLNACSSEGSFLKVATVLGSANEYIDNSQTLQWNSTYTYYIASGSNGFLTRPSEFLDIFTGNELCNNKQNVGSFCVYDVKANVDLDNTKTITSSKGVICDENNIIQTYVGSSGKVICGSDSKCVEDFSGTKNSVTYCRSLDQCDASDENLFGLYFTEDICEGENNENFCVYDSSSTNTDYCYSCDIYSSCSDYRSESSCTQNICGSGSCSWSVTNEELGTGICYDVSKNSCSDCNDPYNRLFGSCDSETCSLLGDCAFSKTENSCSDCYEVSCYDYADSLSCGVESMVSINTKTNEIITGSADTCALSSCQWSNARSSCYKDSNADRVDDCLFFEEGRVIYPTKTGFSSYTKDVCRSDAVSPETFISLSSNSFNPLSPINGEIVVTFNSIDKSGKTTDKYQVKEIRYCIAPKGSTNCKNVASFDIPKTVDENGSKTIILGNVDDSLFLRPSYNKKFQIAPGENIIKYYAIDYANNLEIVKEESFFFDKKTPALNVSFLRNPNYGTKTTDLSVVTYSDEPVYCSIDLDDCYQYGTCDSTKVTKENINQDFIRNHEDSFSYVNEKSFNSLGDGYSYVHVICSDLAGNIVDKSQRLLLDVDPRIQDPKPLGPLDYSTVLLSVKTIDLVTCKYTTKLSQSFEDISSSQTLQMVKKGSLYEQTAFVTLSQDDSYVYYVKCDYDPVASEKISFSLDRTKPVVNITLEGGLPLDEVGWVSSANIEISCLDRPTGGFGCNQTMYCMKDVPNINDPTLKATCVPNLEYDGSLSITTPVTLCAQSIESAIGEMGALTSDIVCKNIFVDTQDPLLVLDSLPNSVNSNSLVLNGVIYDDSFSKGVSLSQDSSLGSFLENFFGSSSYYTSFLGNDNSLSTFDYVLNVDFTSIGNLLLSEKNNGELTNGKVSFLFQYTSPSSYGALTFDFKEHVARLEVMRGSLGLSTIQEYSLPSHFYFGEKQIRVTKSKTKVTVRVQDSQNSRNTFELSGSSSSLLNLYRGDFGVLVQDKTVGFSVYSALKNKLGSMQLFYPGKVPYSSLNKKAYFSVDGQIKDIVSTDSLFSISSPLTEGTPRHGKSYVVQFVAEDISGRLSETIKKMIYFDLSGPGSKRLTFEPTVSQNSSDYIEYATDAVASVRIEDDYSGVSQSFLIIDTIKTELNPKNSNNEWFGTIPTSSLPAGSFDIQIEAYDGLGNKHVQTFSDALLIEDRIEPLITINLENPYVNTTTPTITFVTDEAAFCSASYVDIFNSQKILQISSSLQKNHLLKISSPLLSANGEEIENSIVIYCTDANGNKVSEKIDVIVDLRTPIYSIKPVAHDLIKEKISRHERSYVSVIPVDKIFYSFADEPVICKYSRSSDSLTSDYSLMINNFLNNYKANMEDRTKAFIFTKDSSETFTFSCQDRAGNVGQLKTISVAVNEDYKPHLFNLPSELRIPEGATNQEALITFDTIRDDVSCSYYIDNDASVTSLSPNSVKDVFTSYEIDMKDISMGKHVVTIFCSYNSQQVSKEVLVYKDSIKPSYQVSFLDNLLNVYPERTSLQIVNSSEVYANISLSEPGFILVKNKGIIIDVVEADSPLQKMLLIPLHYGYNDVTISVVDLAGNSFVKTHSFLSEASSSRMYFSNSLGGSILRQYNGSVIVKGEGVKSSSNTFASPSLNPSYVLLKSKKSSSTLRIPLGSSTLILKNDTYKEFPFAFNDLQLYSLSTNLNNSLVSSTYDNLLLSNSLASKGYFDIFNVELYSKTDSLLLKETFFFNPFSESVVLKNPIYSVISIDNMLNANTLPINGTISQENFLFNTQVFFGDETSLYTEDLTRSLLFDVIYDSSSLLQKMSDLLVDKSSFTESFAGESGKKTLALIGENDLGVQFGIDTTVFYDVIGPTPEIQLYPKQDVSFSSKPYFSVFFDEPAYIKEAEITNFNDTFLVSGFDDSAFVFEEQLKTEDALVEEGIYYLNVLAEDDNGNVQETQFSFEYSKKPFSLRLVEPMFLVSPFTNFTLWLQSDRLADCRFSLNGESSYELIHSVDGLAIDHYIPLTLTEGGSKTVGVRCKEFEGQLSSLFTYSLLVDSTKPIIEDVKINNAKTISAIPYITEYPLLADLVIKTNEDSACRYELLERGVSFNSSFEAMNDFSYVNCTGSLLAYEGKEYCFASKRDSILGNLKDATAYDLYTVCKNKAGLESEISSLQFQTDLSQGDKISFISPAEFSTSTSVLVEIKLNEPTLNCTYGFDNDSVSNKFSSINQENTIHKSSVNLLEGRHKIHVSCIFGTTVYNKSRDLIIDKTKPAKGFVITYDNTTSTTRLSARAANFTDDESGIKFYEYAIGTSTYGSSGWNSVLNWTQTERESISEALLNLTKGENYYWSIRALNYVNLYSDVAKSTGTEILSTFSEVDIDSCNNGIKNDGEVGVDCGPVCRSACVVGDSCLLDEDCYSPSLVCENYECTLFENVIDIDGDTFLNYTNEDYAKVPSELVQKTVSAEIITTKTSWIYWLLALGVLILLSGGGYYAYVMYGSRDDVLDNADNALEPLNGLSSSANLDANKNKNNSSDDSVSFANKGESSLQDNSKKEALLAQEKRKEELKKALKKKLVAEQKAEQKDARSSLFEEFSKDSSKRKIKDLPSFRNGNINPLSRESSLIGVLKNKDERALAAKVAKLKLVLKEKEELKKKSDSLSKTKFSEALDKVDQKHEQVLSSLSHDDLLKLHGFAKESTRLSSRAKRGNSVRDKLKDFSSKDSSNLTKPRDSKKKGGQKSSSRKRK